MTGHDAQREHHKFSFVSGLVPTLGTGKRVITKVVFLLEESLESLNSLENGRILLVFHSLGVLWNLLNL